MKKLLITTIGLLLANIITAQTDYSGRTLYRATREKKTALQHTHLKARNGLLLLLTFTLPIVWY